MMDRTEDAIGWGDGMPPELLSMAFDVTPVRCLPFCRSVCRLWAAVAKIQRHPNPYVVCDMLVLHDELGPLRYALDRGMDPGRLAFFAALSLGRADCLALLLERSGGATPPLACAHAAAFGRLDMLKAVRSLGAPMGPAVARWAAYYGHDDVLRYALRRGSPIDEPLLHCASAGGHIGTARRLFDAALFPRADNGLRAPPVVRIRNLWSAETMALVAECVAIAARAGRMDCAAYLGRRFYLCARIAAAGAALSGRARLLADVLDRPDRYGRDCTRRCVCHPSVLDSAVTSGDPDTLRVLLDIPRVVNGSLTADLMARAAALGHRRVTNMLRVAKCPWDASVVAFALARDHPEAAAWALRHGCPAPDEATIRYAEVHAPYPPGTFTWVGDCVEATANLMRLKDRARADDGNSVPPMASPHAPRRPYISYNTELARSAEEKGFH